MDVAAMAIHKPRVVTWLLLVFLSIADAAEVQRPPTLAPYYISDCSCKDGDSKPQCTLPTALGEPLHHNMSTVALTTTALMMPLHCRLRSPFFCALRVYIPPFCRLSAGFMHQHVR